MSLYFIFSLRKNLKKINISRQNLASIKKQVTNLEQKVEHKEKKLDQAKKTYSKEKIARDELLLKKPSEYVIQLPELNLEKKELSSSSPKKPIDQWKDLLWD